jgi:hypothetical protein
MNSDSIFENEFYQKHKGILTIFTTITLAFIAIYWLYGRLQSSNGSNLTTNTRLNITNPNIQPAKIQKKRLSINANDLLFKDISNIDQSYVYKILEKLSKLYDIYLIILIQENQKTENILENLKDITSDNLVLKHVCI